MRSKYLAGMALALIALPVSSQDALRVRQLEGDVQRLERDIQAQSRRIDQLEQSLRAASTATLATSPSLLRQGTGEGSPAWLVSTNWDRVKPGMKDFDVIALLGRPTSVRKEDDGKRHVLLYALELGPSAVLAGNVELTESGVAQINKPVLR
jgi:predicted RNase H-like nuclease (RuvC/YqgF family)